MDESKMPIAFYQISPTFVSDYSFDEAMDRIKGHICPPNGLFKEQMVEPQKFNAEFNIRIFHASKSLPPRWSSFVKEIVSADSSINGCLNTSHSFLLFIGYKANIFAVAGGVGSLKISTFISSSFGIDIITRLIQKNSKVIKSLHHWGVTGSLIAQSKLFRADSRLSDENQFGQIYKEVRAELDSKILTSIFGFKKSDLKRDVSGCLANTSFKINKSMDLNSFLRVVTKLDDLLSKEPNFNINNVERLFRKSSQSLTSKLDDFLLNSLYQCYLNEEVPDYDFVHSDIDKYIQAAAYHISSDNEPICFDDRPSLINIEEQLEERNSLNANDIYEYKHSVLYRTLQTFDENGELLTTGTVLSHIHGEVFYEGHAYFIIDGEWYRIGTGFIESLNAELSQVLIDHYDDSIISQPFDITEDEGVYNLKYVGQPRILVFDTITPDNIEWCDLLKLDETKLYLIHVKKGFNNMFRDLTGQIRIAARTTLEDKSKECKYIQKIEQQARGLSASYSEAKRKLASQVFPSEGLHSIIANRRPNDICFCLAFVDTADVARSIKDNLPAFKSNIAKYSLLELIGQIKAMGFDFKLIQLKKKENSRNSMIKKLPHRH